jgi:hypothetical protein
VTSTNGDSEQSDQNASVLASYTDSTIETIRKTVKAAGKEVSFIRLTQNEKNQLADILYTGTTSGEAFFTLRSHFVSPLTPCSGMLVSL